MKKRLLLIALVIILSTGTVVQTEMHAEAAATTVTVVSVAKAVLVLLAIAGVGIAAGYTWENGEQIKEEVVATFTTWLQNHDPEFYTAFMLAATNIAAGRVINTYDALFFGKLKQYTREYFGTSTSQSTSVGNYGFSITKIAFVPDGSQYIDRSGYARTYSFNSSMPLVGFAFTVSGTYGAVFLPANSNDIYNNFDGGAIFNYVSWRTMYFPNKTQKVGYYAGITGSNITFMKTGISTTSLEGALSEIATKYMNGEYATVTDDVLMKPFSTVGDVAATSADATVVGAGQTITEEDENEIVIDGDRTINLSNVNIDEWLKSLAEGTQTYAQAMEAIGLAAVNTQTMTLEQVQSIAQALNPAAAGTGTITGNYTVALSDLFPFCIPFDLYNIISCFKADPVAPSAEITIPVGYDGSDFTWETYTVSLSDFDAVAAVVRVLEYIGFVIGLMLITRKLIEG